MRKVIVIIAGVGWLSVSVSRGAQSFVVPNGSFELPTTGFASPLINSWQKSAKPDWYVEDGSTYLWSQLTGEFKNDPPISPNYIDNCDGNQGAWMFAVREVSLFQDYDSKSANEPAPTHAFNVLYEVGKAYHLTVAVMGGVTNYGLQDGATVQFALYYRDAASNTVIVAETTVTNDSETLFTNHTHFLDFSAHTPPVRAGDAWAGEHVGIMLSSSITDTNLEGGYWDLDNVRLSATLVPSLTEPAWNNGQFSFTLSSETGMVFEIQATTNVNALNWTSIGFITNATGAARFTNSGVMAGRSFFRARAVP